MKAAKKTVERIVIKAPNFRVLQCKIRGTAPFVSNNFSQEAIEQMAADQAAGEKAKQGKAKREPKDFEKGYEGSKHVADEGWCGLSAGALRAALIRACSMVGIEMTKAKQCFFVLPDGFEKGRGTPLVKITKGKPERFDSYVRNANGSADIRSRARWNAGWEAVINVRYDADMFDETMIANLIQRAGISVGIGAGRPFSTMSAGCGWGTFEIADAEKRSA